MFERLNTPKEAYNFKLGAALKMEQKVLSILEDSIEESRDPKIRAAFEQHLQESRSHVSNLEEAFSVLGWEVDDSPCPAIDGLQAEAKANAKKTDASLIDAVLLQGAIEIEHHEIGVYENLMIVARAMGRDDVVHVLQRNLSSEEQTLTKAKTLLEQVAAVTPKDPADPGTMDKVRNAVG